MKRRNDWWALLLAAAGAGLAAGEEAPAAVRVRAVEGRTALYAATNAAREAVGWVSPDVELTVCGELSDEAAWVRVEPPAGVSLWIYRELVRDGTVTADKSRVRTGPGLNFRAVASLGKGDRVEVRGRFGDWLRIKPPPGVAVWALRDSVEPLAETPEEGGAPAREEEAAAAPLTNAVQAASAPTHAPAVPAGPPPALPPALRGAALEAAPGQGARAALKGVLDYGTVGGFAAPFCLVVAQANGDAAPICHLLAPQAAANPYVGATVVVDGTRWLLKGVALPVIVADEIRPQE